ncbi:MAG: ribonuclease HI family protein [Candidatus Omnitrophota bacterium]|nr:ribonuclease HI family protein [Candidatus Omnitrophota bacterium]
MSLKPALKIQIDGASRGNPGPAGAGVVLSDSRGKKLKELSVYLGESTNNVAETCALILGLQEALRLGSLKVSVLTDSELLARQVTGEYRVKDKQLQWLHALIRNLVEAFDQFKIQHIPREENRAADRLANKAVTEGLRGQLTLFEV